MYQVTGQRDEQWTIYLPCGDMINASLISLPNDNLVMDGACQITSNITAGPFKGTPPPHFLLKLDKGKENIICLVEVILKKLMFCVDKGGGRGQVGLSCYANLS